MPNRSHVFFTGATGLIGRRWLRALVSARPDCRITALVRQPIPRAANQESAVYVIGDLRRERFGLAENCWRGLSQSVTEIIHCAADTRFDAPLAEARRTNTEGVQQVLEFARACPNLEKLAHVSTTYIMGRSEGLLPERRFVNTAGFFSTYEQSKYEAETLVMRAARDIPAAIFRLSSVIGESGTGAVEQFNYFHYLLRMVSRNPLRVMPAVGDAPVDVIASDWAVGALSALYRRHFRPGAIYNICAGPQRSPTVQEIVEAAFSRLGRKPVPKFVGLEEFEHFAARAAAPDGPDALKRLSYFLPHLALRQWFENSRTLALLDSDGIVCPDSRELYGSVIDYCIRTNWGRR